MEQHARSTPRHWWPRRARQWWPRPRRARRLLAAGLLAGLAATNSGCVALAYLFGQEKTRDVKAEYPYLAGKHVVTLVRADAETLFEYPQVQWEIGDHLRVTLEANVRGVKVVPPKEVVDFQRASSAWEQMDPAEIAKRFDADRLLEITLTQYTTREPDTPHLYRGHIAALVSVYNAEYAHRDPAFAKEVQTVFPPSSATAWSAGDRAIRRATLEAFAVDVSNLFYDRKVKEE
jgi:hypothetical protein